MQVLSKHQDLIGLVLAGGDSTRMGSNKAHLTYQSKPQVEIAYQLLKNFCEQVYISSKQTDTYNYPCIQDEESLGKIGPAAGLISAFNQYKKPCFVLAIDYPLINQNDLLHLLESRNTNCEASVFFNPENKFYEPVIGIYEIAFLEKLKSTGKGQNYSLQTLLKQSNIQQVIPLKLSHIQSIDTNADFQNIKNKMT